MKGTYTPTASSAGTQLQQQQLQQRMLEQQYAENAAKATRAQSAFDLQQKAMSGLVGSMGSMGGYGAAPQAPTGTTSPVAFPQTSIGPIPDASAAQNAAFGSAKAKAGAMDRSAVDALRGELSDRGMLGGGTEARGLVDRLASATNPLSDLNVAQQQESLGIAQHSQDLAANQAAQQFAGGITQRGQDIGVQEAAANRAQQARLAQLQMLQQALSGLTRSY